PLLAGADADVPCASVMDSDGPTGEASSAMYDEGGDGPNEPDWRVGWSPMGVGCSLIFLGVSLLAGQGCRENYPKSKGCPYAAAGGSWLIGTLYCQLL